MEEKNTINEQNQKFIFDSAWLLIFTAISVFTSEMPHISIFLCGIMMVMITVRNLSDKNNDILDVILILFSTLLAVISGGGISCLIFYICRIKKISKMILIISFYAFMKILVESFVLYKIIFGEIIIIAAILIIDTAKYMISQYLSAKSSISKIVGITAVNEMYMKQLNQELVIKNYLVDKNARLEERENISRNIHNSVGHSITAAIMALDAADMLFDCKPKMAREKMNTANERIRESLQSIRHAVRVLDKENEFIMMNDFINELNDVTDSFVMDTTIEVKNDFSDVDMNLSIPHEHTEFLTGALQEMLTNGVRHGNADMFTVRLTTDSRHIKLAVSDNGKSSFSEYNSHEKISNGFGLKKLISYAEKCGGNASFENKKGFKSIIILPL